jgi:hypothetical protein
VKNPFSKVMYLVLLCAAVTAVIPTPFAAPDSTTAWHDGEFQVDVAGVIGRSTFVLGQPNVEASQAMPLGNGRLGVASGRRTVSLRSSIGPTRCRIIGGALSREHADHPRGETMTTHVAKL